MILVIGPESSGNHWISDLLRAHPDAPDIVMASYPSEFMPLTFMPDFSGEATVSDVVICVRDWTITRLAQERSGYLGDHPKKLTDEAAVVRAISSEVTRMRVLHWAHYEGLCGPFGRRMLESLLLNLGLNPELYPWEKFQPQDGNAKYIRVVEADSN